MSHTSCDHSRSGLALGSEPGYNWTMCSRLPKTILDSTSKIGNSHQCPDHPSLHHMTFMWPCWSRDRVWGWNPSERVLSDPGCVLRVCDLCSTCSDPIGTHVGRLDGKPWHFCSFLSCSQNNLFIPLCIKITIFKYICFDVHISQVSICSIWQWVFTHIVLRDNLTLNSWNSRRINDQKVNYFISF